MKTKTHIVQNLIWVYKTIVQFDKKYIFIVIFSGIILGIIPPISTIISQEIINGVQKRIDLKEIFLFILIYIAVDLFLGVFSYGISYYKNKFLLKFSLDFDEKLLTKASKIGLKNYENSITYDLINRAQYGANGKLIAYFETFITIASNVLTMLSYLCILLAFNPAIVGIIILIPIAKFFITRAINVENFLVAKERTNDSRKVWYLQHIMTHGEFYKEIKTYGLSAYFINRYKEIKKRFNRKDISLARKQMVLLSIASAVEGIIDGMMFLFVILCGYKGKILIGNVLTYMKTNTQVKEQMTGILGTVSELSKESLYIDELVHFFNLSEENNTGSIKINHIKNIRIEHLYYRYRQELPYVLEDINLQFNKGEMNVIVGQNGSGKTTLMKILMGFYDDYEGKIYVNNIDLRMIDKFSLLNQIATLFQDFVKYEATFRENIAYGNLRDINNDEKIYEIAGKFGVEQLIRNSKNGLECQLGSWFDDGKQISIGQWQKIALSRAFSKKADVYILDEPNAALDAISEYELSKLYQNIMKEKIGLVIAHKFNNFIKSADQVVVLDKGKLIGAGKHEELLTKNSIYREMYMIQQGEKSL